MPIRKTLRNTKDATFLIELPDENKKGMPTPKGTGFFISGDGWFITALHVISNGNGTVRKDLAEGWLTKEKVLCSPPKICQGINLSFLDPKLDFALLKIGFKENSTKEWLKGRTEFPYIKISSRKLEEGEPVYSFGYPLSEGRVVNESDGVTIGHSSKCPRTTSAIVSSLLEKDSMMRTAADPLLYVLDKALNYGNSGGPILAVETGAVHAFCSRFQSVFIPQAHLQTNPNVMIPSLYSIVVSLGNPSVLKELENRGIDISSN